MPATDALSPAARCPHRHAEILGATFPDPAPRCIAVWCWDCHAWVRDSEDFAPSPRPEAP